MEIAGDFINSLKLWLYHPHLTFSSTFKHSFFFNPWGTSSEISKTRGFLKFSGGIGFLMFSWGIEQDHWQKCVNKSSWRRSLREFVAESAPAFIPICVIISIFQYFEECEHLQEMGRVNVENPQLSQRLATIIFWTFRSFYQKKNKKLCFLFTDGVQLAQG